MAEDITGMGQGFSGRGPVPDHGADAPGITFIATSLVHEPMLTRSVLASRLELPTRLLPAAPLATIRPSLTITAESPGSWWEARIASSP